MRERLFDRHNLLFRHLQDRPSIIMGRKGSGKTAYLNSVYFYGKYDHIVELGTSSALQKVVEAVQRCTEGVAFAETVAELWEQFLWVGVLVGLREKITTAEVREAVKAYLTELHIADSQSFDEALRDMVRFFQARAGEARHSPNHRHDRASWHCIETTRSASQPRVVLWRTGYGRKANKLWCSWTPWMISDWTLPLSPMRSRDC